MSAETRRRLIVLAKVLVFVEVLAIAGAAGVLIGGSTARTSEAKPVVAVAAAPGPSDQVVLKVFVAPSGATLAVDGQPLDTPVGEHGVYVQAAPEAKVRLRATMDGFVTLERVVTAPAEGVSVETITLAAVEHANDAVDEKKPVLEPSAEQGSGRAAKATRVVRRSATAESAGRSSRRKAPKMGALVVEYAPRDARVFVDRTPIRGASPVTADDLTPGSHRVEVRANGYRSMRRSFEVSAGQQLHVSFILAKEPEVEPVESRLTAAPPAPPAPPPPAPPAIVSEAPVASAPALASRAAVERRAEPAATERPDAGRPQERPTLLHRALAALAQGRDQFRIAVVHAPGRANGASIRALKSDARKPGIALRLKMTPFRSVADLTRAMDRGKFDALFIDPSVVRATTSILQVSRARKVISLAPGRDLVRSGASVGLVRDRQGAIDAVYVNRRALRVECCRLPSGLLRWVSIVD